MVVSGVQQGESVIYIYTHTHTHTQFLRFFSIAGYYMILSIISNAVPLVLGGCLFCIQ